MSFFGVRLQIAQLPGQGWVGPGVGGGLGLGQKGKAGSSGGMGSWCISTRDGLGLGLGFWCHVPRLCCMCKKEGAITHFYFYSLRTISYSFGFSLIIKIEMNALIHYDCVIISCTYHKSLIKCLLLYLHIYYQMK